MNGEPSLDYLCQLERVATRLTEQGFEVYIDDAGDWIERLGLVTWVGTLEHRIAQALEERAFWNVFHVANPQPC